MSNYPCCSNVSQPNVVCPSCLADRRTASTAPTVVLDVRSESFFSKRHITGAFNTQANSLILRRLKRGTLSLTEATGKAATDLMALRTEPHGVAVLVDDDASNPALPIFCNAIITQGIHCRVLQGGMQAFAAQFPELTTCTQPQCAQRPGAFPLKKETLPQKPYHCEFECGMTQVTDHLYLGNGSDAANFGLLASNGITWVLNVTSHVPNHFEHAEGMHYHRIAIQDACQVPIADYFAEAIAFIKMARDCGERVLVHCHAGISRSSTLVMAYLMHENSMHLSYVYSNLKMLRPIISPNLDFFSQLLNFDAELRTARGEAQDDNPLAFLFGGSDLEPEPEMVLQKA